MYTSSFTIENQQSPDHETIDKYDGIEMSQLLNLFKNHQVFSYDSKDIDGIINFVEIRLPKATLTCLFKNGICSKSYLFYD